MATQVVFTFGKHCGKPPTHVGANYLEWCLREVKGLDPDLRAAIEQELTRRRAKKTAEAEQAPAKVFKLPHPDDDAHAAENLRALLGFWNEALRMVDQASPLRPELRELLDRLFVKAGTIGFRLATAAAPSHSEPPANPITGYPRPRPEYMAWLSRQCVMPGAVLPLRPDAGPGGNPS